LQKYHPAANPAKNLQYMEEINNDLNERQLEEQEVGFFVF